MSQQLPSKTLTHQEEQSLRQRAKELEDVRDGVEVTQGVNYEVKDKASIQKEIRRINDTLSAQSIAEIDMTPAEKIRIEEEEKILRADLQKDMPTWKEYVSLTPRDGSRFTMLVNKIVGWNKDRVRSSKIQRWKTLRRLLDRENPKADSTVHLFPQ